MELDESVRKQVEQSKFVVQELKEQNRVLESERLRLLKKLMRQAELHNFAKDGKFANLSANDQDLVVQYVENLRRGVEKKPLDDQSWELNERLKKSEALISALKDANASMEIKLERALRDAGSNVTRRGRRRGLGGDQGDDDDDENTERTVNAIEAMKREVESMKRDDVKLRESLMRELPKIVRESIADRQRVGRRRLEEDDGEDVNEELKLMRTQIEDLQIALKQSREECDSLRHRSSDDKDEEKPPLHPTKKREKNLVDFSSEQTTLKDAEDNDMVGGVGDSLTSLKKCKNIEEEDDDDKSELSSIEEKDTPMRRLSFSSLSKTNNNINENDQRKQKEEIISNAKAFISNTTTITTATTKEAAEELVREWETALQIPPSHRQAKWAVQMRELLQKLISCLVRHEGAK